jgi:hypothetical protein
MYDLQASRAVKLFTEISKQLFEARYNDNPEAKATMEALGMSKEMLNEAVQAEMDQKAIALTQAVLVAESISSTLGDIGPLISDAIVSGTRDIAGEIGRD